MRSFWWIFLCFSSYSNFLFAQQELKGKILSNTDESIPFANIGIIGKNVGTSSFEDGSFSLSIPNGFLKDSLTIAAIGFETLTISLAQVDFQQSNDFRLSKKDRILEEVVVKASELQEGILGIRKKKSGSSISINRLEQGLEIATLIESSLNEVRIDKVSVRLGKKNIDEFSVRCRFYGIDSSNYQPTTDVVHQEFIETSDVDRGTLIFDLTEKNLWLSPPFFVIFEWIKTKEQAKKFKEINQQYPMSFLNDIQKVNPHASIQVLNRKKIRLVDKNNGKIIDEFKLSQSDQAYLEERAGVLPKVFFQTSKKKNTSTYYRLQSHGKWIRHPETISVAVEISYQKND